MPGTGARNAGRGHRVGTKILVRGIHNETRAELTESRTAAVKTPKEHTTIQIEDAGIARARGGLRGAVQQPVRWAVFQA